MLAQTGAEAGAEAQAEYFKQIVNFAKDAIRTIAPALSSKNKYGAAIAGIANNTDYPVPNPAPNCYAAELDLRERHKKPESGGLNKDLMNIGNRVNNPGSLARNNYQPISTRLLKK